MRARISLDLLARCVVGLASSTTDQVATQRVREVVSFLGSGEELLRDMRANFCLTTLASSPSLALDLPVQRLRVPWEHFVEGSSDEEKRRRRSGPAAPGFGWLAAQR